MITVYISSFFFFVRVETSPDLLMQLFILQNWVRDSQMVGDVDDTMHHLCIYHNAPIHPYDACIQMNSVAKYYTNWFESLEYWHSALMHFGTCTKGLLIYSLFSREIISIWLIRWSFISNMRYIILNQLIKTGCLKPDAVIGTCWLFHRKLDYFVFSKFAFFNDFWDKI